jgi:hypothetical protein
VDCNEIASFLANGLRELIADGYIASGDVGERSIKDVKPDDLKRIPTVSLFRRYRRLAARHRSSRKSRLNS